MPSWNCETHGDINEVRFDGYDFGDRMLEGMYFRAKFGKENEFLEVFIEPEFDDEYWDDLNKKKWLKEAEKHAKTMDFAYCVICNEECIVE